MSFYRTLFCMFISILGCLAPLNAQVLLPDPVAPRGTAGVLTQPLEIKAQKVAVAIEDNVAKTTIEWTFYNQYNRRIEGTFYLPLPQSAVIKDFEMDINGRRTPAELLNAGKANKIYEDIVRRMVDPALLEYQAAGLIKARIFPIEPRSTKVVALSYRHPLPKPGTFHEYHLALNKGKQPMHFQFEADIKNKQPLQTLYAPNFTFSETHHSDHHWSASLNETHFSPQHDLRLYLAYRKDDLGVDLLTHAENGENTFMLRLTPNLDRDGPQPAKDLLFVMDTSGSMAGEKLEQAKRALRFCLANLGRDDRFAIVTFATETNRLSDTWLQNSDANQTRAKQFVADIRALGGTNLEEALDRVNDMPKASDRPMMVMLLSDGHPTIGSREPDPLVAKVEAAAGKRIFVLGIGLKTHTLLLDRIAEKSAATSFHVLPEEDLEIKISDLYRHIQYPVLSDVRFECRGVTLSAVHPKKIADLFAGQPLTLLGRFSGHGRADFRIHGTSAGKTHTFNYQLDFSQSNHHDFLPRLWAQRRIAFLLENYRKGDSEVEEEITKLARRYGIVTPFTAYLIIEDIAETPPASESRPVSSTRREHAPSPMRDLRGTQGRSNVEAVKRMAEMQESDQVADGYLAMPAPKPAGDDEAKIDRKDTANTTSQQAVRFIQGRAFYQRGAVWQDAFWPKADKAKQKIVELQYGSDAWWRLWRKNPSLAGILSLGPEVQFTFEKQLYQITR